MAHPWLRWLAAAWLCAPASLAAARAQQPVYSVIDLGVIGSGSASDALGINLFDEVVGASYIGGLDAGGKPLQHAFVWSPGHKLVDLFAGDTGDDSAACGININGEIAGWHYDGNVPKAFLATTSGKTVSDTETAPNRAYGINDYGWAAGGLLPGSAVQSVLDLFALSPDGTALQTTGIHGAPGAAYAIANPDPDETYGDVAGVVVESDGLAHALFDFDNGSSVIDVSGQSGSGFAAPAVAYAVNDNALAAGFSTSQVSRRRIAVVFSPYLGGVAQTLGTLPTANWSEAYGMNNFDQVVGRSGRRAFLAQYNGPPMSDLNALVAPRSGWLLTAANAINDAGDIVGQGFFNGASHAVLLIPVVLTTLTLDTPAVKGGLACTATVTLSGPAPFDLKVNLSSGAAAAKVPKSVTILQGETSESFQVTTSTVTRSTPVSLRAAFGGVKLRVTLTVTP